jgi:hypothetical protein
LILHFQDLLGDEPDLRWLLAEHPSGQPLGHLDQLGLRPVTEGGKLWLHVPDDEGLLTETQTSGPLNLATDAQIYLDLQRTGLRGPDAATVLREWEGFCLP